MRVGDDAVTTRTIGILLFDQFEELDAVGPWEVLAAWTSTTPDDGWTVTTLSRDGQLVTAAVITSAGVSAGIDMALHLVARLSTVDRAREVRRYVQYDPEPPV